MILEILKFGLIFQCFFFKLVSLRKIKVINFKSVLEPNLLNSSKVAAGSNLNHQFKV